MSETHQHHHGKKGRASYYLEDIPLDQAYARFFDTLEQAGALTVLDAEAIAVEGALGRVTSGPVWARLSSPHYHAAAMDGAAVRSQDTVGATETAPVRLTLGNEAAWIDTGDPMPEAFDAVIMREVVHDGEDGTIEVRASVAPWQHVRPLGEDIVATELVLPENHLLRPQDLGAVAASGLTEVQVRRRPRVAIIPTGNELVSPGEALRPGDIVEYNSIMLGAQVADWGGSPTRCPPEPDDPERIKGAVRDALDGHDVVVINAGSSAGAEDFTARVVQELGTLLVHGVAVRPGHPVVLGVVQGKPVLGIPGYPASAVLTSELFLWPLLRRMLGLGPRGAETVEATMTRKVLSPMGEDEFLRVKLGRVGDKLVAAPLQRGAGVIMSLVRADGLALIPRFSEGVHSGAPVRVELRRPLEEIENTVVAIGSHDVTLDLLASHLHARYPGKAFSSSNVGSLGGLVALERGEAHLAGTHLLDEETGEYNLSYVRRYTRGQTIVLINLAYRVQGLMVRRGNPKGIQRLEDLTRPDVTFVNRQRGSGTRVLLDYKLHELGIGEDAVRGYEREEYTHLAIAADVAGGTADTGLGIMAAARALDLDFVPLLNERFDLAIPKAFYESDLLQPVLEIIRDHQFQAEVEALGGYGVSEMGTVIAEIG